MNRFMKGLVDRMQKWLKSATCEISYNAFPLIENDKPTTCEFHDNTVTDRDAACKEYVTNMKVGWRDIAQQHLNRMEENTLKPIVEPTEFTGLTERDVISKPHMDNLKLAREFFGVPVIDEMQQYFNTDTNQHVLLDGTVITPVCVGIDPVQPGDESKLYGVLADISNMCIGELAMGYKLDAQAIGEMIYEATGMTTPELSEYVKQLK